MLAINHFHLGTLMLVAGIGGLESGLTNAAHIGKTAAIGPGSAAGNYYGNLEKGYYDFSALDLYDDSDTSNIDTGGRAVRNVGQDDWMTQGGTYAEEYKDPVELSLFGLGNQKRPTGDIEESREFGGTYPGEYKDPVELSLFGLGQQERPTGVIEETRDFDAGNDEKNGKESIGTVTETYDLEDDSKPLPIVYSIRKTEKKTKNCQHEDQPVVKTIVNVHIHSNPNPGESGIITSELCQTIPPENYNGNTPSVIASKK